MSKFCTRCGAEMNDDAAFCPKCGAPQGYTNGYEQNTGTYFNQNANTYSDPQSGSYDARNTEYNQGVNENAAPAPYEVRNTEGNYAGITPRNLVVAIILSLVTCGIYGIYWMYKLNEEINYLSGEPNATGGAVVIILSIVTCGIYALYWHYQMGKRVDRMKGNDGSTGVVYLLLAIFGLGIVNYALMQDSINNAIG